MANASIVTITRSFKVPSIWSGGVCVYTYPLECGSDVDKGELFSFFRAIISRLWKSFLNEYLLRGLDGCLQREICGWQFHLSLFRFAKLNLKLSWRRILQLSNSLIPFDMIGCSAIGMVVRKFDYVNLKVCSSSSQIQLFELHIQTGLHQKKKINYVLYKSTFPSHWTTNIR